MRSTTLVADFSKYYEEIDVDGLQYKFDQMQAPTGYTKLLFNTWRGPRIVRSQRHHGSCPSFAGRGVPAGDGIADVTIKVHALAEYDMYVCLHPLDAHVQMLLDTRNCFLKLAVSCTCCIRSNNPPATRASHYRPTSSDIDSFYFDESLIALD